MKYILTAVMALFIGTSAFAEGSNPAKGHNVPSDQVMWFVSTQVEHAPGPGNKMKPFGDDTNVINPHIKDWFVPVEMKDADGTRTHAIQRIRLLMHYWIRCGCFRSLLGPKIPEV